MKKSAKREKKPATPNTEEEKLRKGFSQKNEKILYAIRRP